MSIRRQSIISSLVVYIGFAVGFLNTYFFTRDNGHFTAEQYGLTTIFIAIATMMATFAMLAMPSYIFKFFPYYKDHLPERKNDMLTWSLVVSLAGFALVVIAGFFFKNLVIRKFGEHSPLLLTYYYWIFPMGLGLTIYTILEAYAWNLGKAVATTFMREVEWRLLTTLLIVLLMMGVIRDYDLFIKLYSLTYAGIAVTLFIYLVAKKSIHFTFTFSKVSRRYLGKIVRLCLFMYSGIIIFTISQVFDTIVIASVLDDGLAKAGIFTLATLMASVIQAPQRAIIASSISHLSRAWKDKNRTLLQRIYQRSSINLLIFACGLFTLIALNYREAVITFGLKEEYLLGFNAFILLGLMRIVDMGTGVNAQIISTSNYWKFELVSGAILLALMLPLTLYFTRRFDILGPAVSSLVCVAIYNLIRIIFLWKKFGLFPFSMQSVYTIVISAIGFTACYFAFMNVHGFAGLIIRSVAFLLLYLVAVVRLKLSPDIVPVMETLKKRMRR